MGSADPEHIRQLIDPAIDQLPQKLMTLLNAKAVQLPMSNFI